MPTNAIVDPCASAEAAPPSRSDLIPAEWRVIQMIMYVIVATATTPMIVSSPSCCLCGSSSPTILSATPTAAQRIRANPTPIHICRSASRRPSFTRKAAMTPTMSDASTPSRRVITKVGSMILRRP